jgi:hypothetical protein
MAEIPVSKTVAPKSIADVTNVCHSRCSKYAKAETSKPPIARPPFFWLRRAAGNEKYTDAVADAIEKVEKSKA